MNRLAKVIRRVRDSGVDKAICVSHRHASRVLALSWLNIDIARGQWFPRQTGSISVLEGEKESAAIIRWNA